MTPVPIQPMGVSGEIEVELVLSDLAMSQSILVSHWEVNTIQAQGIRLKAQDVIRSLRSALSRYRAALSFMVNCHSSVATT